MPIQKQNVPINFSGNLDTKTDPLQLDSHSFAKFDNIIRTTGGLLAKRNGFDVIAELSEPYATSLATFSGGLVAVGSSVQVYSNDTAQVVNRGAFQPVDLSVLPAIRTAAGQTSADVAIAPNGLACVVAVDSTLGAVYQVIDSLTGAVVVPITVITSSLTASPRVFLLGTNFIVTFVTSITAAKHLQYIPIPIANPSAPGAATDLNPAVFSEVYEAVVYSKWLYIAFNSIDAAGNSIRVKTLDIGLIQSPETMLPIIQPDSLSVAVDSSAVSPVVFVSSINSVTTSNVLTCAFDSTLLNILTPTAVWSGSLIFVANGITTLATGGVVTIYWDTLYGYPFAGSIDTAAILSATVSLGGSVSTPLIIERSVMLASKAFTNPLNGVTYMLALFNTQFQSTYFLIDGSGNILGKLAYSNATLYTGNVLSSVNLKGSTIQVGYLYRDSISALNKSNVGSIGGLYSTAGVNLATFTLGASDTVTCEIGGSLQLSGGFLWQFDGQKPVEQGFHVYPENLATATGGAGAITAQTYYYQATYEWTDAAGNLNRSAPSVPVKYVVATTPEKINVYIPTLRLTSKIAPNKVRIVLYRWSTANQIYYQVTSISAPTLNNLSVDFITYSDNLPDASIIGNNIIYTTGGVIDNIAAPATKLMALFDDRLWLVDSEDPNLLWFSKQVIEATPVEMSDLLTQYIAPTTSSQGSTGPTTAIAPMDDKLIIFKNNAAYYINGSGPDNTGANNQYSQPIFITSSVGCSNPKSVVLMPSGLMFQTNQGIWLLGRDLSTKYIGAAVEEYNSNLVTSAVNIPGTTQVRFTMDNDIELVYDYFYEKWNTCSTITALSSVIYQGLHTYINSSGKIFQETPGTYLDDTAPVNMSFESPWYNLAGLQGYERAYFFYLLGTYYSPHTLSIQIYYDYENIHVDQATIQPNNFGTAHTLEQWRVFLSRQKCQAFKIVVTEVYDATMGAPAAAGLTLSGLNLVVGVKKGYRPIAVDHSTGAS